MALRNWAGNITFTARQVHRPRTVEQLQELVATTPRIRALGSAHSFNRIADTEGDLVTVADLDVAIAVDAERRTVDVGAGTRFAALAQELDRQGWALANMGSLPHISIAGAAATATHGSGNANQCLSAGVVGIEFVRADGELVQLTREHPDFNGAVVNLGALGVVTRVTVAVVPAFELRQDVWLDAPTDTVLADLGETMAAGYSVSLFTDWRRPDVIDKIWIKSRTDAPVANGRAWGATPATTAQHPITGEDPVASTEQLGRPGPWYERLPHFRAAFTPSAGNEQQTEYLLAREHGAAALAAVRKVPVQQAIQVCEVRTVAADELWLSPFHDRDSIGVHFTWVDDDALVQPVVAALDEALAPFEPRPHWGKVFGMAPDVIGAQYPALDRFRELAARHDPNRRFSNAYLERYIY